ncbi:hypothetical protein [Clostridium sp.]|nr:hypothetical protein [Clostridium sp.]MCI1717346.1 hypothetical protein [Clostridium sp.]MCI1801686.1 hypothetical protein [Clostridium sp.]MCI1815532.1 hypothetical protein [Clostridium sp.]MCI2202334.1 hypothetical protein [Clostridium sp.]
MLNCEMFRETDNIYFPEPVVEDAYCENGIYRMFSLLMDEFSSLLECQSCFLVNMIEILKYHAKFYSKPLY